MLDRMEANLEAAEITARPHDFVADAGDDSDDHTQAVRSHNLTPYLATQRLKHHAELPPVPRGVASRDRSPRSRVWPVRCERRQGVRPTRNERDQSSRPCLSGNEDRGQIKPAGGFRPFARRGIAQMQAEWPLVCLTHNLLKLWRAAPA